MMRVLKRDGRKEAVKFDKITARIEKLCYGLSEYVDPVAVAKRVVDGVYDGVTTSELDNLAAETAASMTIKHPDYANLAARIAVSNLHKSTKKSFSETVTDLYEYINPETGKKSTIDCRRCIRNHSSECGILGFAIDLRPRFLLRLLWVQNARALLLASYARKDC